MDKLIEQILVCENKYIGYFCEGNDEGKYIRYKDNEIKDMYDHNFIELKSDLTKEEANQVIEDETKKCYEENKGFCKIKINDIQDKVTVSFNNKEAEVEHLGVYIYKKDNLINWRTIEGCEIRKVANNEMIKELAEIDYAQKDSMCSKDFCMRRAERIGQVYMAENSCDSYICFYNGMPVGHCELITNNNIAKIENFVVHGDYQRKGIGTTLLKYLVNKAFTEGSEIIYLNADEDDTPKEMYLKLGFKKVYDLYSLFWMF